MWWNKSGKVPEDMTERLERLEKIVKMLELEWTDTYDKFRQLHMRVAKRVQRLEQAPETEGGDARAEGGELPTHANGTGLGAGSTLSPRAAALQRQILERRNRVQGGGEK